jgi:hypothetical protein
MFRVGALFGVLSLVSVALSAAQSPEPTTTASFRRVIRISGTLVTPGSAPSPTETVTFAIYAEERGGTPLWQETQTVTVDGAGAYDALLGATAPDGLPLEIFTTNDARWLSIHAERAQQPDQPRVLIASVAYALRAADADTLGGRPASAYMLADPPAGAPRTADGATDTTTAKTSARSVTATFGTPGHLAQFVDASNLGDSVVAQVGPRIGVGTVSPADYLHIAFNDPFGAFTGLAVQNLSSSANASSGMLFYDQNGALAQFQGFNNTNHAYVINNIAKNGSNQFDGSISFLIGNISRFTVTADGNTSISGDLLKAGVPIVQTTEPDNMYVGLYAGQFQSAAYNGYENSAFGARALQNLTYGYANTAIGSSALQADVWGRFNTAVGDKSALANATGSSNTALGYGALSASVAADANTAIGTNALISASATCCTVALGAGAGGNLVLGSNNIYIGAPGLPNESNSMYLGEVGRQTKTVIAGVRGTTTGNADAVAVMIDSAGQLGTVNSSRRYKEDIQDMGDASSGLMKLRPVTFRYTQAYANGAKPIDFGLIAEEVEQVYPDLVAHLANGDVETVQYHKINAMLLNEVQKQHAELQRQRQEIKDLMTRLEALERERQ